MRRFDAIGFDLLTALLDTWSLWKSVARDDAVGMRWHAASQALLRGAPYRPFEHIVRDAAREVGLTNDRAQLLLARWGEFDPWPDVPAALEGIDAYRRFIVTNCSRVLAARAVARVPVRFELVMTAEEAGAYKPDPKPYLAALERLALAPSRVLFVAGSAHDVGGAERLGMPVYWANRGGLPLPPGTRPLANESGLAALGPTLEG